MSIRIYFVGAHSTGKTTLARWAANRYKLPLVSEVVRTVLAEREIPLDRLKTQPDLHGEVQQEIFERQRRAEDLIEGGYVSDRAIDNIVYAADGTFIAARMFRSAEFQRYVEHVRTGIIFFTRPDRRLLADDGTRDDVCWESVLRIDGAVKTLLEILDLPYVPITPASMQERLRLVDSVVAPNVKLRELEAAIAAGARAGVAGRIAPIATAEHGHGNGNGNGHGNGHARTMGAILGGG